MVDYPLNFKAESQAEKEEKKWRLKTDEGLKTEMSTPEKFGGSSTNPSPEDLFNASLNTCILATFKITAERKNLEYETLEVNSDTSLARNDDGRPVMRESDIEVGVFGITDRELALEVAEICERNCFIHNSVKTEIKMNFKFNPNK